MEIGYCASSVIPSCSANSIHVIKMCHAISMNGHNVHLIVPNFTDKTILSSESVYAYYGIEPSFEIKYLPWLPIKGKAYIFGWLAGKYARENNFDLIYSRNIIAAYLASLENFPVIFESHAPIIQEKSFIASWMFKCLLKSKNFKHLIVITNSLKSWYLDNYEIDSNQILVAPDGADLHKDSNNSSSTRIRFSSKQSIGKFRIGYFGSFYPGKGMEVISKLVEICPELEFNIVGGLEKDINYWKGLLEGYSNIIFHGYYPHKDLIDFMRQMDVLIAPNLESVKISDRMDIGQWTSPLKIFEYMSACRPIIASDIPVLKEILEHNRNALLCDPGNPEKWKSALYNIKDDSALASRLALEAFKNLKEKYTWDTRARNILSAIQKGL
jgi:glycosyltransferase involved in cell wall biosynthesis